MWVSVGVGMSVAQSLDLVLWCMSYLTAAVDVGSGQGGIRRLGVSAAAASTSSRPFDLVIMDIQMRQVNGDEVCRQLVASGFGIPVIAMTGLSCGAVVTARVAVYIAGVEVVVRTVCRLQCLHFCACRFQCMSFVLVA